MLGSTAAASLTGARSTSGRAADRGRRRDCEARLARAAGAGERDEPRVVAAQQRRDRGELERPPDELRRRRPERGRPPGSPPARASDRARGRAARAREARARARGRARRARRGPRGTRRARRPGVRRGRARRCAARCSRSRCGCAATRASSSPASAACRPDVEIEVDTGLEHRQAALVEPRSGGLRERLVGEVCERGAAPERERLAHLICVALGEPLETLDVELVRLHADEIAGRTRHDPVGAERGAQRVDVHLERVLGAGGRRLAPDPVDQPVGGDDCVRLEEQLGQQRARSRAAERHRHAIVVEDLQRPQQAEFHVP